MQTIAYLVVVDGVVVAAMVIVVLDGEPVAVGMYDSGEMEACLEAVALRASAIDTTSEVVEPAVAEAA